MDSFRGFRRQGAPRNHGPDADCEAITGMVVDVAEQIRMRFHVSLEPASFPSRGCRQDLRHERRALGERSLSACATSCWTVSPAADAAAHAPV